MYAPPPPTATRFHSHDLDEVREWITRLDGSHRRTLLGRGSSYDYHAWSVRGGIVDLVWLRIGQRQRVSGTLQRPVLHLPMRRRHVYAMGARSLEAHPDAAVLLAPGEEYTVWSDADSFVTLPLPLDCLADELAHRRDGVDAGSQWRSQEIPLSAKCARDLATLHRSLAACTGPPDPPPDADQPLRVGRRLVSWVADRILGVRSHASAPALGFRRVRQVEEWVDAHLAAPITLGDLCAAGGVGDRWLESAFKRWRGQTPLEFVTSRRLATTRRWLGDPRPGDTVARIALDAGFIHLGRFAAHYRNAYGELPSVTLRRGSQ